MVSLAGASAPLVFLISMVGMVATASSLAQFASIYPSAGSFITYITRAVGTKVASPALLEGDDGEDPAVLPAVV